MANCNTSELLSAAKGFSGLSEKQLDMAAVTLLKRWADNTDSAKDLLWSARCFQCLGKKELLAAWIQLLCKFFADDEACEFSYEPASAIVSWIDSGGQHSGDLADFRSVTATTGIGTVTDINLPGQKITSITLCSDLTSLVGLNLSSCNITGVLDVSQCSALQLLYCDNNPLLTGITLTGLTTVTQIYCHVCSITGAINVSNLSGLVVLYAKDNLITSANVATTLGYVVAANLTGAGTVDLSGTNESLLDNTNKLLLEANGWTVDVTP